MKCIVLVGYMCVGKTTIGRALAKRLGVTFYDLDWYIEERFRKRVPKIFEEDGEERFRDLERRMLHEVAEFENIVLACGGGTPRFFDNMAYMNSVAETYYLQASPQTICDHLAVSKGERPLLKGKSPEELREFVTQQLAERAPFYEQAHHIINVDVLDSFEKVEYVVDMILQQLPPS
ncbi:MAG: shikimate kinase [Bacteroidaceae bacterium]|nr:shikimate kinase [Bacteroidaceae bacterium]